MADRAKWLRIALIIIALDYTFVGIMSLFFPEIMDPAGTVSINYYQISITIGLFAFMLSWDTSKYHDLLWVLVIQEIGVIILHIYQIIAAISDFYMNDIILSLHVVYLTAIILLRERSLIPKIGM
ncbi:MAG: hypothetical protein ACXACR_02935 [Candidatus Hodarchaeales archaeon]|jgi:hypothetical protein